MSDYQCEAPERSGVRRQLIGALVCALLTAACNGQQEVETKGPVEGFAGVVAADEPRAAVVGRDILGNGGNAADAAVAMAFALAVTLPSRAGLAGGGVCSIFDNGDKAGELLEFLPVSGPSGGVLPGTPRAMAALHARQGLLRWEQLLVPAENLARFGHAVSRTFASDLAVAGDLILADPALRKHFTGSKGSLPREGDQLVQFELAGTLAGLRAQGAQYFYGGPFSRRYAEAVSAAGEQMTVAELRAYKPRFREAAVLSVGKDRAYFSAPPTSGVIAAQIFTLLSEVASYDGDEGERAHLLAEAAMRTFAARGARLVAADGAGADELLAVEYLQSLFAGFDPNEHSEAGTLDPPPAAIAENPAGAGFVVGDRFGNGLACSFSMNGLFGSGLLAAGTGILLPNQPSGRANGVLPPSTVVIGNSNTGELRFAAAAGAGGAAAPTALAQVMLRSLVGQQSIADAITAPRVHHSGAPDTLFHEADLAPAVLEQLRGKGYELRQAGQLGRVNAFHCPGGAIANSESCMVATDARGAGLAVIAR